MMNYEDFRDDYTKRHPASVPQKPTAIRRKYPIWLRTMVGLMFIAAAILSGVHTIPTVYAGIEVGGLITEHVRNIAAIASFVAIELAIFTAAYMRRENRALATGIIVVTFLVAVVSNLASLTRAFGGKVDLGTQVVTLVLGFGAPLIALMSGELFVHMTATGREEDSEAEQKYHDDLKAFDAQINSAYTKYTKEAKQAEAEVRLSVVPSPVRPIGQDAGRTTSAPYGYDRTKDAQQKVIEHLTRNPSDARLSSRELGQLLNIGHNTANEGRKVWLAMQTQGHLVEVAP